MANAKTGLTISKNNTVTAAKHNSLKGMLESPAIKARFEELLGKKAPGFVSSLLAVCNNNKLLQKADPKTVIAAGAMAASLDLPINQNLGFAYIIPYGNEAQFQMGYKGYIQLAMRTGQYKTINACEVYEGEIKSINRFTGEIEFGERSGNDIIGYMAYFKLVNGFEKYLYMTVEEMQAHAKRFSKNYKGGTDKWGLTDFNSMAIKTILKRLISKYGILSIEMMSMQSALANDGGVIQEDDQGNLTADFDGNTYDVETGEVIDVEPSAEEQAEIHAFEMEVMNKE